MVEFCATFIKKRKLNFLFDTKLNLNRFAPGELFEWSMEAVLKTVGLIAPGVRIPHSPNFFPLKPEKDTEPGEVPEWPKGVAC